MKLISKLLYFFVIIISFTGCNYLSTWLFPAEEQVAKMQLPEDHVEIKTTDKVFFVNILGGGKFSSYYNALPGRSDSENEETDIQGLRKKLIEGSTKYKRNFLVIIKTSTKAEYKDIVNILDEMTINKITRYSLQE